MNKKIDFSFLKHVIRDEKILDELKEYFHDIDNINYITDINQINEYFNIIKDRTYIKKYKFDVGDCEIYDLTDFLK